MNDSEQIPNIRRGRMSVLLVPIASSRATHEITADWTADQDTYEVTILLDFTPSDLIPGVYHTWLIMDNGKKVRYPEARSLEPDARYSIGFRLNPERLP